MQHLLYHSWSIICYGTEKVFWTVNSIIFTFFLPTFSQNNILISILTNTEDFFQVIFFKLGSFIWFLKLKTKSTKTLQLFQSLCTTELTKCLQSLTPLRRPDELGDGTVFEIARWEVRPHMKLVKLVRHESIDCVFRACTRWLVNC